MLLLLATCLQLVLQTANASTTLQVGSKRFTESYILGEVLTQIAAKSTPTEHQQGLGNTAIVFNALKTGAIDIYAEYTGTINTEILRNTGPATLEQMRKDLASMGIGVAVPLGFNNTYALAVRGDAPSSLRRLSDLAQMPTLRFGLSHEFLGRADGWPGLAARYRFTQQATGLDHGIAYEALTANQVDVIDIYSTDAKINKLGLRVLEDDANYFPHYDAVLLYRLDLPTKFPQAWTAFQQLEGKIDAKQMIAMNAEVELDGVSFANVAKAFSELLSANAGTDTGTRKNATTEAKLKDSFFDKLFGANFWRLTRQHVLLVLVAVGVASCIGIPLGIVAAFVPRLRETIMAVTGILQTVPSLALLAMLIPLLGMIGTTPALIALSLYALLPIVRNTCVGLIQVPQGLRLAASALGLSQRDRLLHIELPLALPVILAGLKTAAVMSVGTATIAAFIGAGGYGERIAIGLALNDNQMLLAGAIPSAALAILTQFMFDFLERHLVRGVVDKDVR